MSKIDLNLVFSFKYSEIFIPCHKTSPFVRILSVKFIVFIFKTLQNKTSAFC